VVGGCGDGDTGLDVDAVAVRSDASKSPGENVAWSLDFFEAFFWMSLKDGSLIAGPFLSLSCAWLYFQDAWPDLCASSIQKMSILPIGPAPLHKRGTNNILSGHDCYFHGL
jgi:hypothetical protein